jgi:hypothetical protein
MLLDQDVHVHVHEKGKLKLYSFCRYDLSL